MSEDQAALFERAASAAAAGRLDEAEAGYRDLLTAWPAHIAAHRGLAEVLAGRGQSESAARAARQADVLEAGKLVDSAFAFLSSVSVTPQPQPLLAKAEGLLRRALDLNPEDIRALTATGHLRRMRGACAAAAESYAAAAALATEDRGLAWSAAVAGGAPPPAGLPGGQPLPVPFVQLADWMPRERRDFAFDFLVGHAAELRAATVLSGDGFGVERGVRTARVLYNPPEIANWVVPRLRAAIPHLLPRLGLAAFAAGRIELQATLYGGGDFYAAHRDTGWPEHARPELDSRIVSFVAYLTRRPRRFRGGELRLYDSDLIEGPSWSTIFTVIEPLDNSIVFFPSRAMHEVVATELESDNPADGRLSINGWIHAAEGDAPAPR